MFGTAHPLQDLWRDEAIQPIQDATGAPEAAGATSKETPTDPANVPEAQKVTESKEGANPEGTEMEPSVPSKNEDDIVLGPAEVSPPLGVAVPKTENNTEPADLQGTVTTTEPIPETSKNTEVPENNETGATPTEPTPETANTTEATEPENNNDGATPTEPKPETGNNAEVPEINNPDPTLTDLTPETANNLEMPKPESNNVGATPTGPKPETAISTEVAEPENNNVGATPTESKPETAINTEVAENKNTGATPTEPAEVTEIYQAEANQAEPETEKNIELADLTEENIEHKTETTGEAAGGATVAEPKTETTNTEAAAEDEKTESNENTKVPESKPEEPAQTETTAPEDVKDSTAKPSEVSQPQPEKAVEAPNHQMSQNPDGVFDDDHITPAGSKQRKRRETKDKSQPALSNFFVPKKSDGAGSAKDTDTAATEELLGLDSG